MASKIPGDLRSFREWVKTLSSPEEFERILALDAQHLAAIAFQHAPSEVISQQWVANLLKSHNHSATLNPLLEALCANNNLSFDHLFMLRKWASERMRAVGQAKEEEERAARENRKAGGNTSGWNAPLLLLQALERSGYDTPAEFWEPFLKEVRKGAAEASERTVYYARVLCKMHFPVRGEDLEYVLQALVDSPTELMQLVLHPELTPELAEKIAGMNSHSPLFLERLLERREFLGLPGVRSAFLKGNYHRAFEHLLPDASEAEYEEIIWKSWLVNRALASKLVQQRTPSAKEFRKIFNRLAQGGTSSALAWARAAGAANVKLFLEPSDWLPLLRDEDPEMRLEVQRFWAQAQGSPLLAAEAKKEEVARVEEESKGRKRR